MGIPVCRVGDVVTGVCPGHPIPVPFSGTWGSGSVVCTADGLGIIRVGDVGSASCGHSIMAVSGSSIVTADGIGVVRIGDAVITSGGGSGTCASGSDVVTAV